MIVHKYFAHRSGLYGFLLSDLSNFL